MKGFIKNKYIFGLLIAAVCLGIIAGAINAFKTESTVLEDVVEIVVTPIQKAFVKVSGGISSFFGYFSNVDKLRDEKEALETENAELKSKVLELEGNKSENDELRKMLALREANRELELESAEIIGRNPSNWYNTITIDKGTTDGVAINQPVISKGKTLIGRVTSVGTTWAEITLITDPGHGVGVMVQRTGELGVIEGDGSIRGEGKCKMSFISTSSGIIAGDSVITSGLGGVYPKGLIVGKIAEIQPDIQGISQYAIVKPEADVENLKLVFVVKNVEENLN